MSIKRKHLKRRDRRGARVHAKVRQVSGRLRLSIYRSLKHFYAQIIDDGAGKTLVASSSIKMNERSSDKKAQAKSVGLSLAQLAKEKGIEKVAFDRGRFLYHGRVAAFAEGAREGGLTF